MNDDFFYRGIVCLNNSGCYLLEKGAYQQATNTLRNAADLCQALLENRGSIQERRCSLNDMLQQAASSTAFPNLGGRKKSHTKFPKNRIASLSAQSYDELLAGDILVVDPSDDEYQFLMCPCRVDSTLENDTTADFVIGVVLLNLAVAYTCVALSEESCRRAQLLDAATNVLDISDQLLLPSRIELETNYQQDIANIHMVFLYSFLQVSSLRRENHFARIVDDFTDNLTTRISMLQNTMYLYDYVLNGGEKDDQNPVLAAAA